VRTGKVFSSLGSLFLTIYETIPIVVNYPDSSHYIIITYILIYEIVMMELFPTMLRFTAIVGLLIVVIIYNNR